MKVVKAVIPINHAANVKNVERLLEQLLPIFSADSLGPEDALTAVDGIICVLALRLNAPVETVAALICDRASSMADTLRELEETGDTGNPERVFDFTPSPSSSLERH